MAGDDDGWLRAPVDRLDGWLRLGGDRPAIVTEDDESWTYEQLADRVEARAAVLQSGGPDAVVPVTRGRSCWQVVDVLALWSIGRVPAPLDPREPPAVIERKLRVVAECAAALGADGPGDVRLVLFTSGSTGDAKPVLLGWAGLDNYVHAAVGEYGLSAVDRVAQYCSPDFDIWFDEVLTTLAAHACLAVRGANVPASGPRFLEWVESRAVTTLNLPTAAWRRIGRDLATCPLPAGLRLVVVGGEAADAPTRDRWDAAASPGFRQVNAYGPTEASISVTFGEIGGTRPISIGSPIRNVELDILDDDLQPVEPGAFGELWIGGVAVALQRQVGAGERFVAHPTRGGSWFRTGDVVRWSPELAAYEIRGRRDDQVKVRGGYRVELGGVEAVLHSCVGAASAAAFALPFADGARVVAAVEGDPGDDLERELRSALPAPAVPILVSVPSLPMTTRGKVDRPALRSLVERLLAERDGAEPPEQPVSAVESLVRLLTHLTRRAVGADEHIDDLGLDSLALVEVASALEHLVGSPVDPLTILSDRSISELVSSVGDVAVPEVHYAAGDRTWYRMRRGGERLWCFFPPLSGAATRYVKMPALLPASDAVWACQTPAGVVRPGLAGAADRLLDDLEVAEAASFGRVCFAGYSLGGLFAIECARRAALRERWTACRLGLALIDPPTPGLPMVTRAELVEIFVKIGFRIDDDVSRYTMPDGGVNVDAVFDAAVKGGRLTSRNRPEEVRDAWAVYELNARLTDTYQPAPLDGHVDVRLLRTDGSTSPEASRVRSGDTPAEWSGLVGPDDTSWIDTHHCAVMEPPNDTLVARWLVGDIPSQRPS